VGKVESLTNRLLTLAEVCKDVSKTTRKKYSEYCKSKNIDFTEEGYIDFMNRLTAGLFYGVN